MQLNALTMCPGNRLYMYPEALDEAKSYTTKLDVFSFGVIVIQTLTREFPNPTDRFRLALVPGFEEPVRVVVPETERRKDHLGSIPDDHSLKHFKKESERPLAVQLSKRLSQLKQSSQYTESMHASNSSIQKLKLELEDLKAKAAKTDEYQTQITEFVRVQVEKSFL